MWCKQCGQDVPGAGLAEEGKFCCPRCGEGLRAEAVDPSAEGASDRSEPAAAKAPGVDAAGQSESEPCGYDGWELDQQLQHIQRVLEAGAGGSRQQNAGSAGASPSRREVARFDPAHPQPVAWHLPKAGKTGRRRDTSAGGSGPILASLAWTALSLGTMALVCGGVLLAWSVVTGRTGLWTIGMPVALCGQIGLLAGLIMQLDGLWNDSRHTSTKLDNVDRQLHDIKTATTMLGASHTSPSAAFYSHLAGGAGPQLLLSDLKSQLDLLALRISQEE